MNGSTPEVEQPEQRGHGVVGVNRREDHVTGVGGLAGDRRGLLVADLTDHDHVGVLPQNRPQGGGEGLAGLGVDLHLGDVVQVVFDRVLDRDDVSLVAVDLAEGGIERGRFSRPGGAAAEEHAVGLGHQAAHLLDELGPHAQVFELGDRAASCRGFA